jgi:hypothetical protein
MDVLAAQTLRGRDLCCNYAFGVAGAAPVNAGFILRRGNERRHRIHVRGENYFWVWLLWRRGIEIETIGFDWNFANVVSDSAEFAKKIVRDGSFVAGD